MAAPTRTQTAGAAATLAAALAMAVPAIEKWEGYSNDPYRDIAGIMTVCIGETHVEMRRYSNSECAVMFQKTLGKKGLAVQNCLPASTPVPTLAAFISLGYNIGEAAACRSSAAKRLWRGDLTGACEALTWWNKAKNPLTRKLEVSRGLSNRRADEQRLCLRGLV